MYTTGFLPGHYWFVDTFWKFIIYTNQLPTSIGIHKMSKGSFPYILLLFQNFAFLVLLISLIFSGVLESAIFDMSAICAGS